MDNFKNSFNIKKFFIGNTIYAFCNVSFISILLIPFLKTKVSDPLALASLISIQSISAVFFMFIGGLLFDRIGARRTFLIGRMADIISISLLFFNNFYILICAISMQGFARGIIFGKYSSYIYNTLSINNLLNKYPFITSSYYMIWDFACAIIAFIAKFLLSNHNYDCLIYMSLILKGFSLISIIIFIPKHYSNVENIFKNNSTMEVIKMLINCAKRKPMFIHFIIFYGLLQTFTYPFASIIGNLLLLDMGLSSANVASFLTIIFFSMCFGTLIPIIFLKKGISVKNVSFISIIQVFFILIGIILYNKYFLIIAMLIPIITFALFEVSIEQNFEYVSNKKIRGTAISLAMVLFLICESILSLVFGYLAKKYSHQTAGIVVIVAILTILIINAFSLFHYKVENEK